MLSQGTHKVRIVGCFTGASPENQTPFYGIEFETLGENPESINWIAYMTSSTFTKDGKETTLAKENTKTLLKLGFQGRSISDLSDPNKSVSDLFETVENINVVVEHETYTKKDGSEGIAAKIKWVNVGSSVNKFDHKQSVAVFKALPVDSILMGLRSEFGVKKKEQLATTTETPNFSQDEIPF